MGAGRFPALAGHQEARAAVARALEKDRLSQSLLVTGAPGVGKERFGLWIGQLLLCDSRTGSPPLPCGTCRSCTDAARLQHPDLHWFFPLARPKAATPEKRSAALEEMRAGELEAKRADPLYQTEHERPPAYFVATIRTIQQLASRRPAVGSLAVIVLGDVEKMVPQEGAEAAANAFLKLLEEPPPGIVFVLTTSAPGALLPTIRSRVLPIRLGLLRQAEIQGYLTSAGAEASAAEQAASAAEGSVARAIRLLTAAAGTPNGLDLSALGRDPSLVFREALAASPWGARGDDFTDRLEGALRAVRAMSPESETHARALWNAAERVETARGLAQGNVNPQLILADLLLGLRATLTPPR